MIKKNKDYLTISLDNKSMNIVEGHFINKFHIKKTVRVELEEGLYKNGRVLDEVGLKKVLLQTLKENKIKSKKVLCTFDSTEVLTRELDTFLLPNKEEMELVVADLINQQLLINTDDYIILYKKIESYFDGEIEKAKIFVGAAPKTLCKGLFSFFKSCGLKPKVLDLNSNSLEKLISKETIAPYNKGNVVIFETTQSKIKVNILKNGKTRFTRNIDLEQLEFTLEDFEKNEKISNSAEPDLDLNYKIDKLTGDVNMVLKFYTSRSLENVIKKAYIFGELDEFNKFIKDLTAKTEISINKMKIDRMLFADTDVDEMTLFYNNFGILLNEQK